MKIFMLILSFACFILMFFSKDEKDVTRSAAMGLWSLIVYLHIQ